LDESVVAGEEVEDEVAFGDLVVASILGVELVLLERSEGVVLIATAYDLLMGFHRYL
jgi:hypothetical protein